MSRMSNLTIDIDNMLEDGYLPVTVARLLEIPITWVYETTNEPANGQEDLSPFETINS